MKLSVAIVARDEARHIGDALASVAGIADEVLLVLDARSTDATAAIAASHGARVVAEAWRGFPAQRNRALELCGGEWVLFLDGDERVSAELAAEIAALLAGGAADWTAGYRMPRQNIFFGRALRGGGWYPDEQLRLLRRGAARYDETVTVHEVAQLDGPSGALRGHLIHLNIETFGELLAKQRAYAIQEAQTLARRGVRMRWRNLLGAPARELWRRYVALGGWRDGALGLLLCGTLAGFAAVTFLHLRAIQRNK